MSRPTIAIVEDEFLLALELESLCQDLGYEVLGTARSATDAQERFGTLKPDILVTDMELGNRLDGVDVVDVLREQNPSLEVVFVTGTQAPEKIQRMRAVSPKKILSKPVRSEELRLALGGIS